jgi:hypothetical protein
VIETDEAYAGMEAASKLDTYTALGLVGKLGAGEKAALEKLAQNVPAKVG